MSVTQNETIEDYVAYLSHNSGEVDAVYHELLIGVTSFFRDVDVFNALRENYIPALVERFRDEEIRVWVAGCSTGEEAYSIAMMFYDYFEQTGMNIPFKIFATDIDQKALTIAGSATYAESIAADVPSLYLANYMTKNPEGRFSVSRRIRESVVFARHNVLKDPPFTNIHLVSCRNLLIYLQPVLQKKVLDFFNFSLVKDGVLLLGSSETLGEHDVVFDTLDTRLKVYRSLGQRRPLPEVLSRYSEKKNTALHPQLAIGEKIIKEKNDERLFDSIVKRLANEFFLCGLLVSRANELLHVMGNSTGILVMQPGKFSHELSKIVATELSVPLMTGLQKSFKTGEDVRYANIKFFPAKLHRLDMKIIHIPEGSGHSAMALVLFVEKTEGNTEGKPEHVGISYDVDKETEQRIRDLEQDLQVTKENLQATIEELETSNEELQATNEELIASNEELQSTNEELQSVNEELFTVNTEYQQKILELTELSNDIQNLLQNAEVAYIFLDENLEVRRFNSQVTPIFHIIESDIGRSIEHITHVFGEVDMKSLCRTCLESGETHEKILKSKTGLHFKLRMLPYRLESDATAGLVIDIIDVTKKVSQQKTLDFQSGILNAIPEAIIVTDLHGEILYWNAAAERLYQWTATEVKGRNIVDITVPESNKEQAKEIMARLTANDSWKGSFKVTRKDGTTFLAEVTNLPYFDAESHLIGVIGYSRCLKDD
jgi:two-component system, chemotaxis family, CheB/CheR fusion protein